jgi:hypothetical protein
MNKRTLNSILALVLLVAFFLPYISIEGFNVSGFQVIFGKDGQAGISSGGKFLFISLLIPIGAIIVLFDSLSSGGGGAMAGYGYWMPIVGTLYLAIMMYTGMQQGATQVGGSMDIGAFLSAMGYAFWATLVASVILVFNKP